MSGTVVLLFLFILCPELEIILYGLHKASQAGKTYRAFEYWERDELNSNLVNALSVCLRRSRSG